MGWLIALAVLVVLAFLPLGAGVKYDESGLLVRLILGPCRITLFPLKKGEKEEKTKEEKPKKKKSPAEKKPEQKPQEEKKSGGKLTDFLPLAETALAMLYDFRKKLRVERLEVKLIMAGDDPCDLATNYGRAWTALGNFWLMLERVLVIKKRDVQVECDFTADQTYIFVRMDVTITLGRLLYIGVRYGLRALKQLWNIRKGGAEK